MTWLGEVGHVLMKDMRQQRRLVVAYVAVVVIATMHAAQLRPFAGDRFGLAMLIVLLVGVFLVAGVVQADSPTRIDAFWVGHPFRPSAMTTTKVVFALLVILAAVVGQALAVRSYDLHGARIFSESAEPTLLFASWAMAAILAGAATHNLRSFALAVVAGTLLMFTTIGFVNVDGIRAGLTAKMLVAFQVLIPAVQLATVAWLYRRRDTRRAQRMGALAIAALPLVPMGSGPADPAYRELPTSAVRLPMSLERVPADQQGLGGQLPVQLGIGPAPDGYRFALYHATALAHLHDGSTIAVKVLPLVPLIDASSPPLTSEHRVRWLGRDDRPARGGMGFSAVLTPDQQRRIRLKGLASVTLVGSVLVTEGRVAVTLPLAAGAGQTRDGLRARLDSWTYDPADPTFSLHTSWLPRDRGVTQPMTWGWAWMDCAVVNDARGEGIELRRRDASGVLDGLVLPGNPVRTQTDSYSPEVQVSLDSTWFRDARLVIVQPVVRGSYPVRLDVAM